MAASRFRFAGGDQRTTILGATGSGKSTCGLWMLSHQRLDLPAVGDLRLQAQEVVLRRGGVPADPAARPRRQGAEEAGLYLNFGHVPGEDDAVEALLWRIWEAENCGLYVDEAPLMPDRSNAFAACIAQGRSKAIPIIACTQRPVGVAQGL